MAFRLSFDRAKDEANKRKHGMSLADAGSVYLSTDKVTLSSTRGNEQRKMDIASIGIPAAVLVPPISSAAKRSGRSRFDAHLARSEGVMPAGKRSDWARVRREAARDAPIPYEPGDGPYDPNDPVAVDAYLSTAKVTRGPGRPRKAITRPMVSLRMDPDVLAALRATGRGWQSRVNALLREAVAKGKL
jgi:uncharacterized protein (DUF4415 family)